MSSIAIIGGSGLDTLPGLKLTRSHRLNTPYGDPSGEILEGRYADQSVFFVPRHGPEHHLAPHCINYRANIAAIQMLGIDTIIATTAVGGIASAASPLSIVIPHQIIDYTYGREHTIYDGTRRTLDHVDFTEPYTPALRSAFIAAAARANIPVIDQGVYGATQGPRLESAAEIDRLARDGCDIVGMTGMPEAALAREMGMEYIACSLVVNWAAGRGHGEISLAKIQRNLDAGMAKKLELIAQFLRER